jgi:hypothetical protein
MSGNGRIPFLDLVTPHLELEEELVTVFRTALKSTAFVGGRNLPRPHRGYVFSPCLCSLQISNWKRASRNVHSQRAVLTGVRAGATLVRVFPLGE